jgi:hypothetical protein
MGDQAKQKAVYGFLYEYALSGKTFTTNDLNVEMGWKGKTASTYRSKHFGAYLERVSRGVYRVLPEFCGVSWDSWPARRRARRS